ncbi:MAG TPA: hypothetical protein VH912_18710 [Streptosporangiaceae bacterium]|jgi:hypothetical protein
MLVLLAPAERRRLPGIVAGDRAGHGRPVPAGVGRAAGGRPRRGPLPAGRRWSVNLLDQDRILAAARAARRVLNVPAALTDPSLSPARRTLLLGVLRRTMSTVYSRGAYPILAR